MKKLYEISSGHILAIDWSEAVLVQYIKGSEIVGNKSGIAIDFKNKLHIDLAGSDADILFEDFVEIGEFSK